MSLNSEWPEGVAPAPPLPGSTEATSPVENPPWGGWDVLRIALLMFVLPFFALPVAAVIAEKTLYRSLPIETVLKKPGLALLVELAIYIVSFVYMIIFVEGSLRQPFWPAICWTWPRRYWPALVGLGVALVSLEGLEKFFRLPQHVPMEEFLNTPWIAAVTGIFAVSFGPLMEELFFRGFLYPVLARRFGVLAAVIVTAAPFALIHGLQLGFAWGLLLIIFLVGLVLTLVRAKTASVAASFIVHVAYNSTLVLMGAIAGHSGLK